MHIYIYKTVSTTLTYGISLYYPLSSLSLTKSFHTLQNQSLRLVCCLSQQCNRTFSSKFIAHKTSVLPLSNLSAYFTCICAHSIKLRKCPSYLLKPFSLTAARSTWYQHSSLHYNRLESYLISQYNSLPVSLRRMLLLTFKRNLKTHLMSLI